MNFPDFILSYSRISDYECHFKSKTRACFDGCAIVFKRSKFALDYVELVEFYRAGSHVLRADNVGIVMRLQPLEAGACGPLCVANTHLYFNPNRGDIKLAQLSLLLATIDAVARRGDGSDSRPHHPVIFCGDLNSEPTSNLIDFLASGSLDNFSDLRRSDISDQNPSSFPNAPSELCLDASDLPPQGVNCDCQFIRDDGTASTVCSIEGHHLRHHLNLSRVYTKPDATCVTRSKRLVTSYTAHGVCSVDHMLYTAASLRLLGYRQIVAPDEFLRVGGIPNTFHGSDHIPILAEFVLVVPNDQEEKVS